MEQQDIPALAPIGPFSLKDQRQLNHKLMECLGFNFDEGRLDVSSHPFSTGVRGDQRITTRFRRQDFLEALLATAHETGHAGYDWTDGSFGYFPSYTMGAMNSTQLFAAIRNEHDDWQDRLARGEILFIRQWLQKHIWNVASSMDSQHILEHATGQGTNPDFFLNHIEERHRISFQ